MSTKSPLVDVVARMMAQDSPFTPTARLVAICVASHMDKAGRAWPSLPILMATTGLGRTAVSGALRALCNGPQAVLDRASGNGRRSAEYRLRAMSATAQRPPVAYQVLYTKVPQ